MSLASSSARPSLRGQFVDADFDFASLGAALWRARYSILRPTLIVALLTFGVVMMIPPKYQSEARVLIVGRDNVFLRPDADKDILDRGTIDQDTITSQAQLMMSREVAGDVITKLELNKLPEFDPAIGGLSSWKSLLAFVGIIKNPLSMTPEERVLDAYYDRLTVFPVEKSHVIVIDFLSENPELAARVANAIADAFLQRLAQAKQDQARNAGQWLSGEIETLRKKVADAESKVEAFRAKSNLLVGPNNTQLSVQQLGDLNTQLATARAQKSDAEAKAKLIRDMLKSGDPIDSSDILNSELIRRLSEQRVTLRAQLAEQSSTLLGNHPRIKELKAQIGDLDIQLRKEAETIARSLENDAKLADARVAAQLATFNQFKSQAVTSNEDDVQLRALEREAKSQRDLLESYLAKYREATARDSHRQRTSRRAGDFARHGIDRAGLSEENPDYRHRLAGDHGADVRHRAHPRASGQPGGGRRRTSAARPASAEGRRSPSRCRSSYADPDARSASPTARRASSLPRRRRGRAPTWAAHSQLVFAPSCRRSRCAASCTAQRIRADRRAGERDR